MNPSLTTLTRHQLITQIHQANPSLSLAHLHSRFDHELVELQQIHSTASQGEKS